MSVRNRIEISGVLSVDSVVDEIGRVLSGVERTLALGQQKTSVLSRMRGQLNQILTNLNRLETVIDKEVYSRRMTQITELLNQLENDDTTSTESETKVMPKVVNNEVGNNKYDINIAQLEHLLSLGHSVREIAREGLLGAKIHHNTIHNFISHNGIETPRQRYTTSSDDELCETLKNLSLRFTNSGVREIKAHLLSQNPPVVIQRDRLAKLFSSIDPVGTARRWAQVIPRRVYTVPTPNSLWHVDTNHALIR